MWVWIKSWDVGFAVVNSIRDILWQFMARQAAPVEASLNWSDPTTVFKVANQMDPLATLSIYQVMISALMISVPFVTAHLCLGATYLFKSFNQALQTTAADAARRQSKGLRNMLSVLAEQQAWRQEGDYSLGVAEAAARSGGGFTSTGVARATTGDGAFARYIQTAFNKGRFDFHFSEQNQQLRGMIAMFRGRATLGTKGGTQAGPLASALLNEYTEQFETRRATRGHLNGQLSNIIPLSLKAKNDETNLREVTKGSSTPDYGFGEGG